MSKTYKLIRYKKGKPIYSRHLNKDPSYHYFRHDHPIARRAYYKSFRTKQKQYFKKFNECIKFTKTNGWLTY